MHKPASAPDAVGTLLLVTFANDPEMVGLTVEAVKCGLRANQMFYDKHAKEWVAEPDARTRLNAAQFVFNNLVGLPLARIESKSMTVQASTTDSMRMTLRSPAAREAIRRMLDDAERETATAAKGVT